MNLRKSKTIKLSVLQKFRDNLHRIANLKLNLENAQNYNSILEIELVKDAYKINIGQKIYVWTNQTTHLNKDINARGYAQIVTITPKQVFFQKYDELIVAKPNLGVYLIKNDKVITAEYNIYTYWELIEYDKDWYNEYYIIYKKNVKDKMKLQFDFAINKPKTRIRLMGIPVEEMKLYGSKEAALAATKGTISDVTTDVVDEEIDDVNPDNTEVDDIKD